jgi:hypothetical protein
MPATPGGRRLSLEAAPASHGAIDVEIIQ